MKINHEKMTAEIDLMNDKTMYVVKDGQLIPHELPDYGETVVITMGGNVDRFETKEKRKV
ncbi:XtrA/YqaO family protein [Bacillus sp. 37MA]|uniref:XtrA/YqaO family protein n=1 Tax=Bacillus sp. 37MA TaxID=1132442 RepID=UPI000371FF36|nr:XtrA/YqaO family protein [Bacillus sp. 37MA]